jgi:hypothetical protein
MNVSVGPSDAASRATRATLSIDNQRLFVAAVLLAVVPLWFGRYLPMVDLPGHAAVIAALQEIAAGNRTFTEAFEAHWTSPYLLAYLLFYVAALVLPMTIAAKLVVSLAIAATALMTAALLRAAGADERWRWLAIPASYSYAFYWGFISFIVAVPLVLLLLIMTIRFDESTSLKRGLIIAATTVALFYSHIIAAGYACMICLAYLAAKNYRTPRQLILRSLPYATPIPLILIWFASFDTGAAAEAPIRFGSYLHRLSLLLGQPAGLERVSALGIVITCAIVVLPPLAGSRVSRSPARWLPFALGLAVFLAAPSFGFQTGFLYERLGVFLVPLWLMMWDRASEAPHKLAWLAMPLTVVWLFGNVARFASFARETQHFDAVLATMEPGKRVGYLAFDSTTPLFSTPIYLHFANWYQATKLGIVDFNFADFHTVIDYKQADRPRVTEELPWYPQLFDWERNGGATYDYFIIKANDDVGPMYFRGHGEAVELAAHSGWWWVYRKVAAPEAVAN